MVQDHRESNSTDEQSSAADARDAAADLRDRAAAVRDRNGDERDHSGVRRDVAAVQRDAADVALEADVRAVVDESAALPVESLIDRSARARAHAASDRSLASQDRQSGAGDRFHSAGDRAAASSDRDASAHDRHAAATDHLTGVYGRRAGLAELDREIARARRVHESVVVAFFDVDGLKEVNDTHGHHAGDRMLAEFAATLSGHLRPYDLVMRYGGDEFVCVLSGISLAAAQERLAPLAEALRSAPEHGSASVGIAELLDGDTADDVIGRADEALYLARRRLRPS